jgi:hypothetical protein
LRAIGKSSQQPFAALYAATRGYITIELLDRRSASFETAASRPPQDEDYPAIQITEQITEVPHAEERP